jgi:aryl-alcohol dehydrogenase-like predicted oxidoreductase
MRYRPFGGSGVAVSSVSICLTDNPKRPRDGVAWSRLIHAALETGINCFEVHEPNEALLQGLSLGFGDLERRLYFVVWRAGAALSGETQTRQLAQELQAAADDSGLEYFDLLLAEEPAGSPTPGDVAAAAAPLQALTESGLVRLLGVRGEGDGLDAAIATGAFDAMATPYSLASGWRERHRIKEASKNDMAVIGLDPHPEAMVEAAKGPKPKRSSIWRRSSDPLSGSGSYQFLNSTHGWTAEEICLSFALSEPALSTVQVQVRDEEHLHALADTPERDMPAGVGAQIEMARFSPPPAQGERRRA